MTLQPCDLSLMNRFPKSELLSRISQTRQNANRRQLGSYHRCAELFVQLREEAHHVALTCGVRVRLPLSGFSTPVVLSTG